MATNRPRYTVSVDNELFEQIENFRFEHRFNTRSEATVELIRMGQKALEEEQKKDTPLFVIESALLPEAGYEDICQEMWYIYTKEAIRRERLKASRGYSDERITRMIASQNSEELFREVCTHVIDNSGDFKDTEKQIGEIL